MLHNRSIRAVLLCVCLGLAAGCGGGKDADDGFAPTGVKVGATEGTDVQFTEPADSSSTTGSTIATTTTSRVAIATSDGGFPEEFPVPPADSLSLSGNSTVSQTLTVSGETMDSVRQWLVAGLRQRSWHVDIDTDGRIEFSGPGSAGAAVFAENGDGDIDIQIVLAAR